MNSDNLVVLYIIGIFVFNLAANILIKKGAVSGGHIIFNKMTAGGYCLFLAVIFMSIHLIVLIEMKYFSMVMAVNYFLTYLGGIFFFKEKTNRLGIAGIVMIVLGLIVFYS